MENFKLIPGGICAPAGFSAAGVHCGIRHNHSKLDLALIKADVRCAGAGCYTTNKVYGAPITVDREHLKDGYAQAIVVNSGNANTCAPNGIELAKETCEIVAKELGISADDVLPSSTGVIGQAMSIEPFAKGIPEAAAKLAADEAGSHDAATAIMTTDTHPKEIALEFAVGGKAVPMDAQRAVLRADTPLAELLETLRQYLYCNGNLVKTSQALFIHRNTLLYRLNQIRDLLGRDIDDALVRLELLSSIVAKDYLEE